MPTRRARHQVECARPKVRDGHARRSTTSRTKLSLDATVQIADDLERIAARLAARLVEVDAIEQPGRIPSAQAPTPGHSGRRRKLRLGRPRAAASRRACPPTSLARYS